MPIFNVKSKDKPKWYELRKKLSNFFVLLARKIYPYNKEIPAWMMEVYLDQAIYGKSFTRIDPKEFM